jgi:hypothetical protein
MWKPHEGKQETFCKLGTFEGLMGGAAGGGKTDCLVALATRHIGHPRYKGLLLRRTFPRLQEVIDRCWEQYPQLGGVYRSTQHRWFFPSGATILLGHMQHEDDMYDYQGKQYHFIGWDELTQFTQKQYEYLVLSRIRTVDQEIPVLVRATTNPGGVGHRWVKERFISNTLPGKIYVDELTQTSRCFIPALVYDNPTLMLGDPGYVKRLEGLPELERKRLLYGDWESFEGQVLSELSQSAHGCEPFDIPPEWERYMVFDWGFAKPFSCGWYAVDYDGNIFRYREWYGCKDEDGVITADTGIRMIAQEVAAKIIKIEAMAGEKIRQRLADPSIFNKTPGFRRRECIGETIAEDMNGQGVFFLKADNDRINGKQQVHRRLSLVETIDNDTGEIVEHAQFFAFNDQKHFWRTMMELQENPSNPEDVDTKQEDHIYDEVRYMCMARPVQPKKVEVIPTGSFQAERRRLINARKYAATHGISLTNAYKRVR